MLRNTLAELTAPLPVPSRGQCQGVEVGRQDQERNLQRAELGDHLAGRPFPPELGISQVVIEQEVPLPTPR